MTDAELIELLRSKQICTGFKPDGHGDVSVVYGPDPVTAEAADRIDALTAQLESTLKDRKLILEERDRTFALMLARVEKAEAERDRIKDLNELLEEAQTEWSKYASAWVTAEGKLEDAVQGLEKCQAELDEYSRQEYPLDHPVHERYRQRDYDANPARITLAALKGENQ